MKDEELLPAYGELYTLQDFVQDCGKGIIFDEDGTGYYSDGRVFWRDEPVLPSDMVRYKGVKYDMRHRFVIWFNNK